MNVYCVVNGLFSTCSDKVQQDFICSGFDSKTQLTLIEDTMEQICMIVDFDGYQVNHHPYIVRELGLYSVLHGSFSWFLENQLPYVSLEKRDRKTVNYVYHDIHGLRFESTQQEKALPQHMIKPLIDLNYQRSRTSQRNMVAYKGGHLEKDLLNELRIPCVNLEDFGCLKVEKIIAMGFDVRSTCGRHGGLGLANPTSNMAA